MAEYVTVIRELKRMCHQHRCKECPIAETRHRCVNCNAWINSHPEEVECIVMKWAAEHPLKTNRDKFEEIFGIDIVIALGNDSWLYEEYKEKKDETEQ